MCYCKTGNENSLRVQKRSLFPPYENKERNTTHAVLTLTILELLLISNKCPIKNMTPTFHNSNSTLSPNFLWKKSEMIDEIKEHKALIVKSRQYLCVQFCGLNCVNTIFLVKLELLDKIGPDNIFSLLLTEVSGFH